MFGSDYGCDRDERDSIEKCRDEEIAGERRRQLLYKMKLKEEGTLMTMEATEEIQKMMDDFGDTSIELEKRCKILEANNMQLTKELGDARGTTSHFQTEVDKLKLKNSKLEVENLKLRQQMLILSQENEAKRVECSADYGSEIKGGDESDDDDKPHKKGMDKGMHPYEVFPEEVWEMIFGHLKISKDVKSCYDTCTTFQSMLQGQAKIFLFTEVLKILATRHPEIVEEGYGIPMTLKTCRAVCHEWKQCVDNFLLEDTPSFPHLPVTRPFSRRCSPAAMHFKFTRNPWNDPVMQSMGADINPFIRRYLTYSSDFPYGTTYDLKKNYRHEFWEFLWKFGSHVWIFKPIFGNPEAKSDTVSRYTKLVTWLSLMPNLKILYIRQPLGYYFEDDSSCGCEYDYDSDSDDDIFWLDHCKSEYSPCDVMKKRWLRQAISDDPFPTMKNLKIVAFEDCPASLMEAVLLANPQIERMEIHRGYHNQARFDMNTLQLDKLYELNLTDHQRFCADYENVSWKLRKLTINVRNVDWVHLFKVLGKSFGETLLELELQLKGSCHARSPRLYLPKLKKLNMKLTRCFNSIDFIMPLLGLEYLSVNLEEMGQRQFDMDYVPVDEIIETIKFHQFTHDLKNSNIWQLLPKLKSVRARTDRAIGDYVTAPTVNSNWQCCTRDQITK